MSEWVWSVCQLIQTGENISHWHFVPHKSHLEWPDEIKREPMRCQTDDKPPDPWHGPGHLVTGLCTHVYQCNDVHCHTDAFPWMVFLTSRQHLWLLATSLERYACEDTGYLSDVRLLAVNVTQVERFAIVCYVIMSSRVAFPPVVHTWQADKWSVRTTVSFCASNGQVHELWERSRYDQEAFGKMSVKINQPLKQKDAFLSWFLVNCPVIGAFVGYTESWECGFNLLAPEFYI
jgi:hypothetical protein